MTITNRLRVVRAERRVSQFWLANQVGINPTRVWKIENGYVVPNNRERRSIAQALGVSEAEIWKNPRLSEVVQGGR